MSDRNYEDIKEKYRQALMGVDAEPDKQEEQQVRAQTESPGHQAPAQPFTAADTTQYPDPAQAADTTQYPDPAQAVDTTQYPDPAKAATTEATQYTAPASGDAPFTEQDLFTETVAPAATVAASTTPAIAVANMNAPAQATAAEPTPANTPAPAPAMASMTEPENTAEAIADDKHDEAYGFSSENNDSVLGDEDISHASTEKTLMIRAVLFITLVIVSFSFLVSYGWIDISPYINWLNEFFGTAIG